MILNISTFAARVCVQAVPTANGVLNVYPPSGMFFLGLVDMTLHRGILKDGKGVVTWYNSSQLGDYFVQQVTHGIVTQSKLLVCCTACSFLWFSHPKSWFSCQDVMLYTVSLHN